jgi:hypothetical protein
MPKGFLPMFFVELSGFAAMRGNGAPSRVRPMYDIRKRSLEES